MAIYSPSFSSFTNPYKFLAYRNSSLALAANSVIVFDTEVFDTSSNYSVSNGRFTAPVAGFYQLQANMNITPNAASIYIIELYKNGSSYASGGETTSITTDLSFPINILVQSAANDYWQIVMATNSGSNTTISVGSGPIVTYFSGFLVSVT